LEEICCWWRQSVRRHAISAHAAEDMGPEASSGDEGYDFQCEVANKRGA